MGRFLSIDPQNADAEYDNPQTWNAYAYTFNNPLKYVDPDGLAHWQKDKDGHEHWVGDKDGECDKQNNTCWNERTQSWENPEPRDEGGVIPLGLGPFDVLFIRIPNFGIGARIGGWFGRAAEGSAGKQIQRLGLEGAADLANKLEAQTIVAKAASTVGDQSVGVSSRAIAEQAAKEFVGEGALPIVERSTGAQVGWKSADGLRTARFTSAHKAAPYINLENKATGGNLHVRFQGYWI